MSSAVSSSVSTRTSSDGSDNSQKTSSSSGSSSRGWHNAVAGSVAGAGSRMATAPLDLIRIRRQLAPRTMYPSESLLQSWINIVRTEGGVPALFRGNLAAIYLWMGYAAVQFSLYNSTRSKIEETFGWKGEDGMSLHPTLTAFAAGATAGVCSTLSTYPFDLCRTTFAARGVVNVQEVGGAASAAAPAQPQPPTATSAAAGTAAPQQVPYHSVGKLQIETASAQAARPPRTFWEFGAQLYEKKGWRGFYAGAKPATVQIVPYMGLNFAVYDTLTRDDRSVGLSGYAGSVSGAFSKLVVYPMDTIKRRLQAQAFFVNPASAAGAASSSSASAGGVYYYSGMVDCGMYILREEGWVNFYRGVVPSVLKSTIASGLSFAFFRMTKNALESMHDS